MIEERRCPICDGPLPPPNRGHDHRPQRTYCSRACAAAAWKRMLVLPRFVGSKDA